jgi:hypothetical protein
MTKKRKIENEFNEICNRAYVKGAKVQIPSDTSDKTILTNENTGNLCHLRTGDSDA